MKNISLKTSTVNSSISSILEELELLLDSSDLFYGHGSVNAKDEALALILSVLKSDYPLDKELLSSKPSSDEFSRINNHLSERINTRKPMSYIQEKPIFVDIVSSLMREC